MTDITLDASARRDGWLADRVVLITGMSGAGHTTALRALEDAGCEAVDNLPLRLMAGLVRQGPAPSRGLAIGVDVRTRDFAAAAFIDQIVRLRKDGAWPIEVIFLDCDKEVLCLRYSETRRRHPLAADRSVSDGIAAERRLLAPLRDFCDVVFDTSHTNVHELASQLRVRMGGAPVGETRVFVTSFAYRNGLPRDADLVFDTRFLRNPHYVDNLRGLSGRDGPVGDYIAADPDFEAFFADIAALLERLLPRFNQEGKSYLTIALGCTGGRHRSVYVAERLAAWLAARTGAVDLRHRELAASETVEGKVGP